ncbi:MAG: energy coupling factor transporter S component ThiW [Selenomonadales bacterium]|nr:energy coupling factor transporter S component ThiW [Selenomonadales bacterium]
MHTKKLTLAALLVAIGVATAHLVVFPLEVARIFPVQHAINVVVGIVLGPWWAVGVAFCTSLLRNVLGTGSPLAFPGSMIGAFLAGFIFTKTHCRLRAVLGEVIGTGFLGALVAFPIARYLLGRDVAAFFFVVPFLASSTAGAVVGYILTARLSDSLLKRIAGE